MSLFMILKALSKGVSTGMARGVKPASHASSADCSNGRTSLRGSSWSAACQLYIMHLYSKRATAHWRSSRYAPLIGTMGLPLPSVLTSSPQSCFTVRPMFLGLLSCVCSVGATKGVGCGPLNPPVLRSAASGLV